MKKLPKIAIQETLAKISPYELHLSKEEAFNTFGIQPEREYDSVSIDFIKGDDSIYGYSDELILYGRRMETDEEYVKRVNKIKQSITLKKEKENLKLQQEKALYEKLKKKFEK